jgi:hypothetical protein
MSSELGFCTNENVDVGPARRREVGCILTEREKAVLRDESLYLDNGTLLCIQRKTNDRKTLLAHTLLIRSKHHVIGSGEQ